MAKTISTSRKINAILLNIKLNRSKLVSVCGYVLAINFILSLSENIASFRGGATFFDSHCSGGKITDDDF